MDLAVFKERAAREGGLDRRDADVLIAEVEKLLQKLEWSESTNNFDAKRLRRLATMVGAATPESDETMLGCAGTVIGSICFQVQQLQSSLTRSKAEGRLEGMEEAAKIAEGPHGLWGSPLESQRIALDIRYRAEQECKEMEEVAKLVNQK